MKNILPWDGNGRWLKGNLHCHSTMSDGSLTPEQLTVAYREKGYSFLAFSEHELFTHWQQFDQDGFLIIPAIERAVLVPHTQKCYHIHGIQGPISYGKKSVSHCLSHGTRVTVPAWQGLKTVQSVIDELQQAGNLVMFNHPVWSLNELEDLLGLSGYFAVEIFNYGCVVEDRSGCAALYWDSLLQRGIKVWGIATDDNHNRYWSDPSPLFCDSFGGWVQVKAKELNCQAIGEALQAGRFYSSSGPEIHDYGIADNKVFVACSAATRICFFTNDKRRRRIHGEALTGATFELDGSEKYVRIECEDQHGKIAWTNPIFIK